MRFISQYPGYKFQARPQRQRSLGDESIEITQEPIYCEFLAVGAGAMIYENEIAAAIKHFEFRGNTQHEDEATPSDPMLRLAVYDTDEMAQVNSWDDETKAFVEARLIWNCDTSPSECVMVMDTPISKPFPAYDEWDGPTPEMLIVRLIEDGHDLALVLHYERTFGPKRQRIIEALEQTIEAQKESVVSA
jgi:ribosomal protein S24E